MLSKRQKKYSYCLAAVEQQQFHAVVEQVQIALAGQVQKLPFFEFKIAPTFLRWPRHFYEAINRLLGHAFQGIIKENLYNSKNSRNPLQLLKTSFFKEKLCLNYSKHSPVRHLTFGEFLQRVLMALSSLYPSINR